MNVEKLKTPLLRQSIILILYLAICSVLLFDRKGGADITFAIFLSAAISLHQVLNLLILIVGILTKKFNYINDFLFGIILVVVLGFSMPLFMNFMWWFTSLFLS